MRKKGEKQNKAICVLNVSGRYGGAEKRMVALFNYVTSQQDDFYLLINGALYQTMVAKGVLTTTKNVEIVDIPFDKVPLEKVQRFQKRKSKSPGEKSGLKEIIGGIKYFLKIWLMWLVFSISLVTTLRKYQITSMYTVWQGGVWGWPWCRWLKVKLIYGANSNLDWHLHKGWSQFLLSQYWVLKKACHVDFLSWGLKAELQQLMGQEAPANFSVSPCSFVDYNRFKPLDEKKKTIVFMGRLVELKNPLLFLEAVKDFNTQYSNASDYSFLVIGEGPMLGAMLEYAESHKLKNVDFLGNVTQPETYLQDSMVFLSIQETENYPSQALLEAMACENAIVASDVGETRKLVGPDEGILVKLDVTQIAKAIITLVSDDAMREGMGQSARKRGMVDHTVERFANYVMELLNAGDT
jgi:glycosyltransferase involved in cell wall biosynthesis